MDNKRQDYEGFDWFEEAVAAGRERREAKGKLNPEQPEKPRKTYNTLRFWGGSLEDNEKIQLHPEPHRARLGIGGGRYEGLPADQIPPLPEHTDDEYDESIWGVDAAAMSPQERAAWREKAVELYREVVKLNKYTDEEADYACEQLREIFSLSDIGVFDPYDPQLDKNVIIVGMPGTGKRKLCRKIARAYNMQLIDDKSVFETRRVSYIMTFNKLNESKSARGILDNFLLGNSGVVLECEFSINPKTFYNRFKSKDSSIIAFLGFSKAKQKALYNYLRGLKAYQKKTNAQILTWAKEIKATSTRFKRLCNEVGAPYFEVDINGDREDTFREVCTTLGLEKALEFNDQLMLSGEEEFG